MMSVWYVGLSMLFVDRRYDQEGDHRYECMVLKLLQRSTIEDQQGFIVQHEVFKDWNIALTNKMFTEALQNSSDYGQPMTLRSTLDLCVDEN